jgi:hypothetical protein
MDSVTTSATVAEQQAAATAILAGITVGAVADQQAAVLSRLVTIADEDPDDSAKQTAQITRRGQGHRHRHDVRRSTVAWGR